MDTPNLRRYEASLEAVWPPSTASNHPTYHLKCEWGITVSIKSGEKYLVY